jgi:glutathione S-transferase
MAEEPRTTPLVPDDFVVPTELRSANFRLEPLGPEHNARDHAAWMSSIAHLQTTPGFEGRGWPPDEGFPAEQNLDDLVEHADEFERRVAFAYSVLKPDSDDVIGCVYIDPGDREGNASVRSWVRADVAELDGPLREAVRDWLKESWPFTDIAYAG